MTILFCNVGWMERYKGISSRDHITGGGAFVEKNGRGYEVCNFACCKDDFLYGYVQTPGKQIDIDRIGRRNATRNDNIDGVTVVWTAKQPSGRTVIVGWYKDATVFREYQKFDKANAPEAQLENNINGYWIKAPFDKATLLTLDNRIFEIPRGKGFMGQSNVWYADSEEEASASLVREICALIHGGTSHIRKQKTGNAQDQEKKVEVEKAAIRACCAHFESLGYDVASVERDNVGWDLVATDGRYSLRIEVKGLSGTAFSIELTPNEYNAFTQQASDYRLAVVVNALAKNPLLSICRYSDEQGAWVVEGAEEGRVLEVITKKSASIRCI